MLIRLSLGIRRALSTLDATRSRVAAACRSHWSGERGQALIEFAFMMPIIFVFLLTLVDFGIAVDRRQVLQHAVREGARYGAVGNSVASIQDYTVDQSQGLLEAGDVSVCYMDMDGDATVGGLGDNVRVSASFTYNFTVGSGELLTAFGIDPGSLSVDMTPSADMRLETTVSGAAACP